MSKTISLEIDDELGILIDNLSSQIGLTPNEFINNTLRRLLALERFESTRHDLVKRGQDAGYFTDEDIFNAFS
ncbi:MAG: CopG family transcriptional regulator [Nitrospirae bacterium]|nr:CopG family transcriptional regulator [Nitrospirota bacterium]MBF0541202.1 CopG family transcriptional regulator [Nitrospirota bacterium]